jgi:hypothetical protein
MPPEAAPRPGTLRRLRVDLVCLACGDADQLLVEDLRRLPPLPHPCARCRGSMLATNAIIRQVPDPDYHFGWSDGSPRRGPPPARQSRP